MQTQVIPHIAEAVVDAGILACIPVFAVAFGTRIINGIRDARLPWTPNIELAAFAAGGLAGAIVFFRSISADLLGPTAVFAVGGPWDLTFGQFIARAANPLEYDFSALFSLAGIVVVLIAGAIAIAPLVRFAGPAAMANASRNVFLVLAGTYTAIYGLGYCFWLLNRLNFWVFLLLMMLVHTRSKSNKVIFKLN